MDTPPKKRSKVLYTRFLHIPFQYVVEKSIGLRVFHAFGRIFVLLAVFLLATSNPKRIDL